MTMRPYRGIDTRVSDAKVRLALQEIDMFLREATQALSANISDTPAEVDASAQFLVLSLHPGLAAERRAVVSAPIAATDGGANGTWSLSLNNAAPAITFAGTGAAGTDTAAALRTDATLVFPQALRSIAATSGDTLTLTSDEINLTLTPSRVGADLIFADQAAATVVRLFSTSGTDRGMWVNGHVLLGQGTADSGTAPGPTVILRIAENVSVGATLAGLLLDPTHQADLAGGTYNAAFYALRLNDGFEPMFAGGPAGTINLHEAQLVASALTTALTSGLSRLNHFNANTNTSIPAGSAQWTEVVGFSVGNLSITGQVPLRSYGARLVAGNGATAWALHATGDVQISSTNRLRLGQLFATTKATNSLRARTAAGSNIVMELAAADEYEWDTAAFFSVTNGANGLGKDGNGWRDLWLKDTVAAFETRLIVTNTGMLADNTLTLDLGNANRTLTLTGNATLDQNVSTTGTPQFARLGIGAAADGTVLLNVNDSVAAPSTSALTGFTSKYGGDTVALGDPAAWLRIRVAGSTYKVPLFT